MMFVDFIWLLKLVLSHLLTDFILQPKSWVEQRNRKHFASPKLYLHALVTGIVALLFIGVQYWAVAVFIGLTHLLIDGWKSYRKDNIVYFLTDQFLHLAIIVISWLYSFFSWEDLRSLAATSHLNSRFWLLLTGYVILTTPAGILIGQMTKGWREKISNPETLANAGKWIGIIERTIVFLLVLLGQYPAISLLIAAKGIIRFSEKDRPEVKTEYLVIGTLLSIAIAMTVGIITKKLTGI